MATPDTETDVCNLALAALGSKRIVSIDDPSDPLAVICSGAFAQVRREVLRSSRWPCATKRAALSASSSPPAFGWENSYDLPTDFLRLCELNGQDSDTKTDCYDIEGSAILCNETTANVRYIYDSTDVSTWDPGLVQCVSTALAARIAMAVTGNDGLEARILQQFESVTMPRTVASNSAQSRSNENHPLRDALARSEAVNARFRSTTGAAR